MQVERVRQHHVTYLLLQKRINSGDFTAVGAFVGGKKKRRKEEKKKRRKKKEERKAKRHHRQSGRTADAYLCWPIYSGVYTPLSTAATLHYTEA